MLDLHEIQTLVQHFVHCEESLEILSNNCNAHGGQPLWGARFANLNLVVWFDQSILQLDFSSILRIPHCWTSCILKLILAMQLRLPKKDSEKNNFLI